MLHVNLDVLIVDTLGGEVVVDQGPHRQHYPERRVHPRQPPADRQPHGSGRHDRMRRHHRGQKPVIEALASRIFFASFSVANLKIKSSFFNFINSFSILNFLKKFIISHNFPQILLQTKLFHLFPFP